ncbi:MAG: putative carbohydrate/purine kinase [Rhodospirillales bacterium]|jgi:sugar/nucleoside kinase (ribokinase family)|nr:putative carbohydrate/purine kinase [Rhodospirillales bacterium]
MANSKYDVTAIGNAIVDVLAHAEDKFLVDQKLAKGAMSLIDPPTADRLYGLMNAGVEASGGSAANTIAGLAGLGGTGAFIGKVAKDKLGEAFTHDIRAAGVAFDTPALTGGPTTARCLIFVTPDAQRTMQTFLGACVELGPEDVEEDKIKNSEVVYLEGYLFDPPRAKEAFFKAAKIAAAAKKKVSLTLSDAFCVGRYRAEFLDLIKNHVDILFANEAEITSLFEVDSFDKALSQIKGMCEIAALTRSEKGSVIVKGNDVTTVDAEKGIKVVDTTGAGDAYAAGFLYGYTQGKSMAQAGKLGGMLAAEIISHYGARAESDLKQLAKKAFA